MREADGTTNQARAGLAAVGVAMAHDVLSHRLSHPAARVAARFGSAAAALAIARAAGATWPELGLGREYLRAGARVGAVGGGIAATAVLAGAAMPATRALLRDERAVGHGGLVGPLARITFAVAVPEELIYRSALLGMRWGDGSQAQAVAWSSALFGLSHVLPTLSTMSRTALGRHLAGQPLRQGAFVVGNVAATALAGAAFAWLRLRSGSVLAPVLAHAALDDAGLLAGRLAHGLGSEPDSEPDSTRRAAG